MTSLPSRPPLGKMKPTTTSGIKNVSPKSMSDNEDVENHHGDDQPIVITGSHLESKKYDNDNDDEYYDDQELSVNGFNDAEKQAVEAGRRMAQEQQQRLLHQQFQQPQQEFEAPSTNRTSATTNNATASTIATKRTSSFSVSASGSELEQLRKNLLHTTSALDKERAKSKELQLSVSTMQIEMTAMKRELAVVHRVSAPGGSGPTAVNSQAKEIATLKRQLQLAQNEVEMLKAKESQMSLLLTTNNNNGSSSSMTMNQHSAGTEEGVAKLRSEVRSLESQRAELLNIVKKQNRLIDVLKRQKMHLEAAKLLQISEDEFRRALQMDPR